MFIDELKFYARAGRGGDGVVRWRREKFIAKGGPNGGDGGRGGSVYAEAVQDIHILSKYKHKKSFEAEDGEAGMGGSKHGENGEDMVIKLPIGSKITNAESGAYVYLEEVGQRELLLKGGAGGYGNEHFKSSINTTPKKATKGTLGEDGNFVVELELFADVGLVGFPNAGKSSLLNSLTNAKAKIGSYQFTTLDPNLGDFYGFVIADIPGLIEGAKEGKGLGTKFLRHIKRTKMLVHLVSFNPEKESDSLGVGNVGVDTPMMLKYKAIRKELEGYDKALAEKDEIILLTKTDTVEDQSVIENVKKEFEKLGKPVFTLSLYDDESIKNFQDNLVKILRNE